MIASILIKTTYNQPNLPEYIKASLELIKTFREIDNFTKTKKMSLMAPSSPPTYQWERIL
jgi:hypothetical protein